MSARVARNAILGVMFAQGILAGFFAGRGASPPPLPTFLFMMALTPMAYVWYYLDAQEHHFKRSVHMGVGVILLTLFAIPYYLFRSREAGARMRAIARYVGFVVLCMLTWLLSSVAAALVGAR